MRKIEKLLLVFLVLVVGLFLVPVFVNADVAAPLKLEKGKWELLNYFQSGTMRGAKTGNAGYYDFSIIINEVKDGKVNGVYSYKKKEDSEPTIITIKDAKIEVTPEGLPRFGFQATPRYIQCDMQKDGSLQFGAGIVLKRVAE